MALHPLRTVSQMLHMASYQALRGLQTGYHTNLVTCHSPPHALSGHTRTTRNCQAMPVIFLQASVHCLYSFLTHLLLPHMTRVDVTLQRALGVERPPSELPQPSVPIPAQNLCTPSLSVYIRRLPPRLVNKLKRRACVLGAAVCPALTYRVPGTCCVLKSSLSE